MDANASLVAALDPGDTAIAAWSDDRRKMFVQTLQDRSDCSKFILLKTAQIIAERAYARKFISDKHTLKVREKLAYNDSVTGNRYNNEYFDPSRSGSYKSNNHKVGGRDSNELIEIALQRAELLIKELPPLKKAVLVVSPELAKKIDRRDKLLEKGQAIKDQLDPYTNTIKLADLDQKMTIAELRQTIIQREKVKAKLVAELAEIGKEGLQLENQINEVLFSGLPGVTDAILNVIGDTMQRRAAMDEMVRRAGERVLFGDNQAALEILKHFEKDEVNIDEKIRAEFSGALAALGLAVKKGKIPKELQS